MHKKMIDCSFKEARLQKEKNAVIITKDLLFESFQTYNVFLSTASQRSLSSCCLPCPDASKDSIWACQQQDAATKFQLLRQQHLKLHSEKSELEDHVQRLGFHVA